MEQQGVFLEITRNWCVVLRWPSNRHLQTPDLLHGHWGPQNLSKLSRRVTGLKRHQRPHFQLTKLGSEQRELQSHNVVHLPTETSHLTSVIRELEVGKSHNACVSVYNTTYTCNAPMHMCTVMHTCTHTDSSAQSSWAGEKDLKLCQERNTMKRNNPHRCARAGGQGHAQTGFLITYLKPWLLPKQRNGASDLDKRGRAIIHVNRLHRRETEGERYSSMKANVPGPGNEIWLLRPDTSQRESGRGLGRPLPLTLPGPLPALKASPAHGPAGRPQPPRTDGSSHNLTRLPRKAPQSPPHQLQEQKQMGSGT